jgi:argininosuccinate synthase
LRSYRIIAKHITGGLDTSIILRWLLDEGYEVVCFLANVGQEEDWDAVKAKAAKIGATKMIISDMRREFVEQLCFRAIQCNAQYEGR